MLENPGNGAGAVVAHAGTVKLFLKENLHKDGSK